MRIATIILLLITLISGCDKQKELCGVPQLELETYEAKDRIIDWIEQQQNQSNYSQNKLSALKDEVSTAIRSRPMAVSI